MKRIIFAAAGSAGHLEPARAVASWVRTNHPEYSCEFVISDQGVENELLSSENFLVHRITKAAFPRRLNGDALLWPLRFLSSLIKVRSAVRGADAVLGFGGFICAPTYLMAKMMRVPVVLHEANVLPGWANKLGMRLGASGLVAFEATRTMDSRFAPARLVGMPLRSSVYRVAKLSPSERGNLRKSWLGSKGLNPDRKTILVFGGSLGAQSMNRTIQSSIADLRRGGLQVVHVVGGKNALPEARDGYLPMNYLHDMPEAMASVDLVISRSGAVTCAELAAIGTFALLVPLEVGNGEQKYNASVLESLGMASVISNSAFTPHYLSANIISLLQTASNHSERHDGLGSLVYPNTVAVIGETVVAIASAS